MNQSEFIFNSGNNGPSTLVVANPTVNIYNNIYPSLAIAQQPDQNSNHHVFSTSVVGNNQQLLNGGVFHQDQLLLARGARSWPAPHSYLTNTNFTNHGNYHDANQQVVTHHQNEVTGSYRHQQYGPIIQQQQQPVDHSAISFDQFFQLLTQYYLHNGHCRISEPSSPDSYRNPQEYGVRWFLWEWTKYLRERYAQLFGNDACMNHQHSSSNPHTMNTVLTPERISQLQRIGFDFHGNSHSFDTVRRDIFNNITGNNNDIHINNNGELQQQQLQQQQQQLINLIDDNIARSLQQLIHDNSASYDIGLTISSDINDTVDISIKLQKKINPNNSDATTPPPSHHQDLTTGDIIRRDSISNVNINHGPQQLIDDNAPTSHSSSNNNDGVDTNVTEHLPQQPLIDACATPSHNSISCTNVNDDPIDILLRNDDNALSDNNNDTTLATHFVEIIDLSGDDVDFEPRTLIQENTDADVEPLPLTDDKTEPGPLVEDNEHFPCSNNGSKNINIGSIYINGNVALQQQPIQDNTLSHNGDDSQHCHASSIMMNSEVFSSSSNKTDQVALEVDIGINRMTNGKSHPSLEQKDITMETNTPTANMNGKSSKAKDLCNTSVFTFEITDPFPTTFEERFDLLKQYHSHHGHCHISLSNDEHISKPDYEICLQLSSWTMFLRQAYQKSTKLGRHFNVPLSPNLRKEDTLTPERMRLLESIGFFDSVSNDINSTQKNGQTNGSIPEVVDMKSSKKRKLSSNNHWEASSMLQSDGRRDTTQDEVASTTKSLKSTTFPYHYELKSYSKKKRVMASWNSQALHVREYQPPITDNNMRPQQQPLPFKKMSPPPRLPANVRQPQQPLPVNALQPQQPLPINKDHPSGSNPQSQTLSGSDDIVVMKFKTSQMIPDPGTRLNHLPACEKSIKNTPPDSAILPVAYRLLNPTKRKLADMHNRQVLSGQSVYMKYSMLMFQGYFCPSNTDVIREPRNKTTVKVKPTVKFRECCLYLIYTGIEKYYHLGKIRQMIIAHDKETIIGLCDLFAIDRSKVRDDIDLLVDILVDFLAKPNSECLIADKTNGQSTVNKSSPGIPMKTNRRGKRLIDLPACKKSIEETPVQSEVVCFASKLLFNNSNVGGNMENILAFNGYMPDNNDSNPDKYVEQVKKMEAIMGQRAHRLSLDKIVRLCDFFAIDRSLVPDHNNKFALVNLLLDFLSLPHSIFLINNTQQQSYISAKYYLKRKYANIGFRCCLIYAQEPPSLDFVRRWMDSFMICHHNKRITFDYVLSVALQAFRIRNDNTDEFKTTLKYVMKQARIVDDMIPLKKNSDGVISNHHLREWIDSYLICYFHDGTLSHAYEMVHEKFGHDTSGLQLSLVQMRDLLADEIRKLCNQLVQVKIRFTF